MCYTTLGEAQAFWAPQIDGMWTNTTEGWVAELKRNVIALMKGHTVRIKNLIVQQPT